VGALSPYFNPAAGASYLEFWSADGSTIIECRKIESLSGNVVTLDSDIAVTHVVNEYVKARYDGFSPVRGTHGIDGGYRLLGSGQEMIRNEVAVTNLIAAGLLLCARLICGSETGQRHLGINFIFRKPVG
jgi:hypothetical protein